MPTHAIHCHVCTVQEERPGGEQARITADLVAHDGTTVVALYQYETESTRAEEDQAVTGTMLLSLHGWATLAEMWILRYPETAQRIVTKAQGWEVKH
jgi:hypothetical protein